MGIKNLNRFLIDNCSKKSIKKIHLKQLENKTIVVDTSIYMYKFVSENSLLEKMYLFVSIFKKYNIKPIFVFDGKPPPEKRELLYKRRLEKLEAEKKYNELQKNLENEESKEKQEETLQEMEYLKKQFIRIRDEDIQNVKELLDAYGITYYDSEYEADQLCAYLVKSNNAWGCISDDMDMFLYGCNRILRHLSLLNYTIVLYDVELILKDLIMSEKVFREIMVLSGTDYNLNMDTSLYETMKLFDEYNKYIYKEKNEKIEFYDWLLLKTKYIKDYEMLKKVYNMFLIDNYDFNNLIIQEEKKEINMEKLQKILEKEGFIFVL